MRYFIGFFVLAILVAILCSAPTSNLSLALLLILAPGLPIMIAVGIGEWAQKALSRGEITRKKLILAQTVGQLVVGLSFGAIISYLILRFEGDPRATPGYLTFVWSIVGVASLVVSIKGIIQATK